VVGGAVVLMPRLDPASVMSTEGYGQSLRGSDRPAASRFGGRLPLDPGEPEDASQDVRYSSSKRELGDGAGRVPRSASGRLVVVPATTMVPVRGQLVRYLVEVEDGLPYARSEFANTIQRVLNDSRSWGHGGTMTFQQVSSGKADFRIALASPQLTDRVCLASGNATHGQVSCFARKRNTVMINALRWIQGAPSYGRDLSGYRVYLINHEVGHRLGHQHTNCPGPGRLAPIMLQQTKGLGGCRANPWPFA
jgi:hypothetical protein